MLLWDHKYPTILGVLKRRNGITVPVPGDWGHQRCLRRSPTLAYHQSPQSYCHIPGKTHDWTTPTIATEQAFPPVPSIPPDPGQIQPTFVSASRNGAGIVGKSKYGVSRQDPLPETEYFRTNSPRHRFWALPPSTLQIIPVIPFIIPQAKAPVRCRRSHLHHRCSRPTI